MRFVQRMALGLLATASCCLVITGCSGQGTDAPGDARDASVGGPDAEGVSDAGPTGDATIESGAVDAAGDVWAEAGTYGTPDADCDGCSDEAGTDAADTDAGSTDAANTDAANTDAANTDAANTDAANTDAGSADPGPDSGGDAGGLDAAVDASDGGHEACMGMSDAGAAPETDAGASIIALATGGSHSCAVLPDGTVRCWGLNLSGQLGDGTTTGPETCKPYGCSTVPVAVTGVTHASAVAAGTNHSCAITSGTVQCWGSNTYGELGNGKSGSSSSTAVAVSGLTGVTAIVAGSSHTCALLSGGTVSCWGDNTSGQLGTGDITGPATCPSTGHACSPTPVTVPGLSGVTALASGYSHTCALLSDGTIKCWGSDVYGAVGSGPNTCGSSACATSPVTVAGVTGATAITADGEGACAIVAGGAIECWGRNDLGEFGNGTTGGAGPAFVSKICGARGVADGVVSTCAILADRTVACWGINSYGELGLGTSTGPSTCGTTPCSTTPVLVPGLSGVTALSAGASETCAVAGGHVVCWGMNNFGELGNGTSTGPSTCGSLACGTSPGPVTGL